MYTIFEIETSLMLMELYISLNIYVQYFSDKSLFMELYISPTIYVHYSSDKAKVQQPDEQCRI